MNLKSHIIYLLNLGKFTIKTPLETLFSGVYLKEYPKSIQIHFDVVDEKAIRAKTEEDAMNELNLVNRKRIRFLGHDKIQVEKFRYLTQIQNFINSHGENCEIIIDSTGTIFISIKK